MFSELREMYLLETDGIIKVIIFFVEDYIAAFYENVCIYLKMKSETLNFARY